MSGRANKRANIQLFLAAICTLLFAAYYILIEPRIDEEQILLWYRMETDFKVTPAAPIQSPIEIQHKTSNVLLKGTFDQIDVISNIAIKDDIIYAVGHFDDSGYFSLLAFDLLSKRVLWKYYDFGLPAVGEQYVYFPGEERSTIVVLDRETGKVVNTSPQLSWCHPNPRSIQVTSLGILIEITNGGLVKYALTNAEGKQILGKFDTLQEWQIYLLENLGHLSLEDDRQLIQVRGQDRQFQGNSTTGTVQSNELILDIQLKFLDLELIMSRREDGAILHYSKHPIVSNFAVENGVAYFVTAQSELIALDLITGETVGSAQFSPIFPDKIDFNALATVGVNGETVVVHMASSQQLFWFTFDDS